MDPDAYQFHRVPNTPANHFQGELLISDQVSPQDIGVVWRTLEKLLQVGIPGDIAEFGCYAGTTSLFIRRLLDRRNESAGRMFHAYDSFAGLPEKSNQDQSAAGTDFAAGKLAVSKKEFLHQFRLAALQPPIVHKNWFENLTAADVPATLAFAFLDGDFYASILTSLQLVWPRLSPGGAVLIDDYGRAELPGAARAVQDFFRGKTQPDVRVEHNIAIIHKDSGV